MTEENSVFIVPCIHNSDINEKYTASYRPLGTFPRYVVLCC